MGFLAETDLWEAGIYQLEQLDPVDAGTAGNGISNVQGLQLANRTGFLKAIIDTMLNNTLSLNGDPPQFDSTQLIATTNWVNTNQARYVGVKRVNTTLTLGAADYGKLLLVDALTTTSDTVTVPSLAAVPEGACFHIKHDSLKPLLWQSTGGEKFVAYNTAPVTKKLNATSFYTAIGDEIILIRSNTNSLLGAGTPYWIMRIISGGPCSIAEIRWDNSLSTNIIPVGYLPADGAIKNRVDYPRLWNHIASIGGGTADATWLANPGLQSGFSSGDGSTTFRMPSASAGLQAGFYIMNFKF